MGQNPPEGRPGAPVLEKPSSFSIDTNETVDLIATAILPDGGKLVLLKYGEEYSIQLDDEELMGNSDYGSEEALATRVAERLPSLEGRILIGGLGMGFTLGAALEAWGPHASVEVAELLPEVVGWARGPLAHIFGDKLCDPRLTLALADVHDVIASSCDRYDAILLDVDNGPDGFVQDANERLYSPWGLRSARAALRPGGVLAVWSAYQDAAFVERLRREEFSVEEVAIPALPGGISETNYIWLASKLKSPS